MSCDANKRIRPPDAISLKKYFLCAMSSYNLTKMTEQQKICVSVSNMHLILNSEDSIRN